MKGELDAAIGYFREAVRYAPEAPDMHFNLGCALRAQNLSTEAILEFKKALRLRPNYTQAEELLRTMEEKPR